MREGESLGLKNDYESRRRQFDCYYTALFGPDGNGGIFSMTVLKQLITNSTNIIGYHYDWAPLKKLMETIANRIESIPELFENDFAPAWLLDKAIDWHEYDSALKIAKIFEPRIELELDSPDSSAVGARLRLGIRVYKIFYLMAKCDVRYKNEEEAERYKEKFSRCAEGLDELEYQMHLIKKSEEYFSNSVSPYIVFLKDKATQIIGKGKTPVYLYYNALKIVLSGKLDDGSRIRIFPYIISKIFEYQILRITDAIKQERRAKVVEYTISMFGCLAAEILAPGDDAESLRQKYLQDSGLALIGKIEVSVKNNIPDRTSSDFNSLIKRSAILHALANLLVDLGVYISNMDAECYALIKAVAVYLAKQFVFIDYGQNARISDEAVAAARIFYFLYANETEANDEWLLLLKKSLEKANSWDKNVKEIQARISESTTYRDLFRRLRDGEKIVMPNNTPDFVNEMIDNLSFLKDKLNKDSKDKLNKDSSLQSAILDFVFSLAASFPKLTNTDTDDIASLIDALTKPEIKNVERIKEILTFLRGNDCILGNDNIPRKGLEKEQYDNLHRAFLTYLGEKGLKDSDTWLLLADSINGHSSKKFCQDALSALLVKYPKVNYANNAFNTLAIRWMQENKKEIDEVLGKEDVIDYFTKYQTTTWTASNLYRNFATYAPRIHDRENRDKILKKFIEWCSLVYNAYSTISNKAYISLNLGLLYTELGDYQMALKCREECCWLKNRDYEKLANRLTVISRFEEEFDDWSNRRKKIGLHNVAPANEIMKDLRGAFKYLTHSIVGQKKIPADYVAEYREKLRKQLNNPFLHFQSGRLIYQYVFKTKFAGDKKSYGACADAFEADKAIEDFCNIIKIPNGILRDAIVLSEFKDIPFSDEKLNFEYRTYWPSIRSAVSAILNECRNVRSQVEIRVSEVNGWLSIAIVSYMKDRSPGSPQRIKENIEANIGGHSGIADALWGLCNFGIQYGAGEPVNILGSVTRADGILEETALSYIIQLPSIKEKSSIDKFMEISSYASEDTSEKEDFEDFFASL